MNLHNMLKLDDTRSSSSYLNKRKIKDMCIPNIW